jgi:hypothetical protein
MDRNKLLVVANQTVDSDELHDALHARAGHGPLAVTLLIPQDQQSGLGRRVNASLSRLHAAGIDAEAMLGDVDPACAVIEVWDPRRWDEILVSTLPPGTSRWLRIDLPRRIAKALDAPVTHVECPSVAEPVAATVPA